MVVNYARSGEFHIAYQMVGKGPIDQDAFVDVRHGRYIAEHIPGARYVELEGEDHFPLAGDPDAIDKEIEGFLLGLTGVRRSPNLDRGLATVLFTDIVGSTEAPMY